jgi:ABC-type multidrug transport system ATPase subunit
MSENSEKVIETIHNEELEGLRNKAYVDEECNNNLSEIIIEQKSEKTDGIINEMNVWLENDMKITENQINLNNENKMSFLAQSSTPVNSLSVNVSNVSFSIGSAQILSNIDMRVVEGTIYCLIGPSGCGKTTLLRCIIGSLSPKSGDIQVFGYKPTEPGLQIPGRRIGYMPQETALYVDMSVSEILCFFGRVNLIERKQLQNRINFLLAFLNLIPLKDSLIGHLSGGQKRRVSFAAALIHSPPLLILDEPTAGVDPLLRDSMWRHLIALARLESVTVIITTHYVEEARRADTLALMRLGRIVNEESPQLFLDRMQVKTFEEGFYKLCKSSDKSAQPLPNTSNSSVINETMTSELRTRFKPINNSSIEYSLVLYAVLRKNWSRNRKHYELFAFQFFMPIAIVIIFCFGIGAHPFDIPVAVVNDECPPNIECQHSLSKNFLNSIDPYFINQYNYTDFEDGLKAVKSGLMWAVIYIKPNFSQSLEHRLTFEFEEEEAENITIEQSTVRIYADLTNKIISITMRRVLEESFINFAQNALNDYGYNPKLATPPIIVGKAIYGSDNKHKG